MTYEPENGIPTHSAAWHYEQAERYGSLASMTNVEPLSNNLDSVVLVNPGVQMHLREMALFHAQMATVGAMILRAENPHDVNARDLREHARGMGTRERHG